MTVLDNQKKLMQLLNNSDFMPHMIEYMYISKSNKLTEIAQDVFRIAVQSAEANLCVTCPNDKSHGTCFTTEMHMYRSHVDCEVYECNSFFWSKTLFFILYTRERVERSNHHFDATVHIFIGHSLCSVTDFRMSVAGTESWFSYMELI